MADSTDIDVLVVAARATARELNELLDKLSMAGVRVSVVQPNRQEQIMPVIDRVELGLVFPAERAPGQASQFQSAQQQAPYALPPVRTPSAQERDEIMAYAKKTGIFG